ncbi:MAG: hypothetical protein K9L86_05510 [Candidatus Omnitrophica bacterium]|nr:hypothetical protein [Candidatus Omnitrophota bacterium]
MKVIQTIVRFLKVPILFIFFSYLVLCACYNLGGADYFFHTKVGEYITISKVIPKTDIFSFTMNGKGWVDHEWLYQALIYRFHDSFGLQGFFILRIVLFSLIFFLLTVMVLKANWVFGFPLLVYGLQLALRRFTLRPDNFSLLFMIIFLLPFVFKKKWLLWLLPFVQLIWVNVHGFFFLGPLILILYLILSKFNKVSEDKDFYKMAKVVFFGSIFACLFTPQPLAVIGYPLTVIKGMITGQQALFYKYIQELESPLRNIHAQPQFFIFIIFAILCLCFLSSLNWFYLGLGVLMLIFSINSLRNMYFFIPVAIAIFVDRYPVIKETVLRTILHKKGLLLLEVLFVVYSVNLSIPMAKKVIQFPKLGRAHITRDGKINKRSIFFSRDLSVYPKDMIDFMKSRELPERMFNSFNLGAAMIFNFFPQRQVFIDGRAEFYGHQFFSRYREIVMANEKVFDEIVEKYQIEGFALTYFRDSPPPLIKLLRDRGYQCIYFGQKGIIFVSVDFFKKNPKLKQDQVNFASLELKKLDLLNEVRFEKISLKGYFNMANILHSLGHNQKSREYLEEILRVSPGDSDSYYLLSQMAYQEDDYQKAFIHCRKSLLFHPTDKAHRLLAKIYLKLGNIDGAKRIAESLKISLDSLGGDLDG